MSNPFEEVRLRCQRGGLEFEDDEVEGDEEEGWSGHYCVRWPRGRETIEIYLSDHHQAMKLLEQPFELYRGIERHEATWSSQHGVVECNILGTGGGLFSPADSKHERLQILEQLGVDVRSNPYNFETSIALTPDLRAEFTSTTGLSISIGPCSDIHLTLLDPLSLFYGEFDTNRPLSIQIRGANLQRHDDALELLSRVAESTLFQIDISLGLPLILERRTHWYRHNAPLHGRASGGNGVGKIRYEYDHQPLSLYWLGKTAKEMPLLQFLAYYQVLEFYFPHYSETATLEALQSILKEPVFEPTRKSDIARLLKAIKVNAKSRAFGSEAEQLEATIRQTVIADDLRDFLMSGVGNRYAFYTSNKAKRVVKEGLPLQDKSGDIMAAASKRIYAIRNRIVHTKSGYGDQEALFPFDAEVKYLNHDIDLVEFLARKVLITSSRPLQA